MDEPATMKPDMPHTNFSSFDSYTVAEVDFDPNAVIGFEDASSPRLWVPVQLIFRKAGGAYAHADLLFDSVVAVLDLQPSTRIASAHPVRLSYLCKADREGDGHEHIHLEFPLTLHQLEFIESRRNGDVAFKIWLSLTVKAFGKPLRPVALSKNAPAASCRVLESYHINADLWLTIPASHWGDRILPGLGFGKIQMVELPAVSLASCEALGGSYAALKRAEYHLKQGAYDDAAGACRIALDPFFEQVDKPNGKGKMPVLKRSWETRLGEATYSWLDKCMSSVKGATNVVHHKATGHFDRFEAQMIFMVTTTLISYAARLLDATE